MTTINRYNKVDQFFLKQGDVLPDLTVQLMDGDVPLVFNGDETVQFFMKEPGQAGTKASADAQIVDGSQGMVRHEWLDEHTDVSGIFFGEFRVTYPNGEDKTYPNNGYIYIYINPNLE